MKRIIFFVILLIIFFPGCKTVKTVPLENRVTVTERLVPISLPQDSAIIRLVFKHDYPISYSETKSAGVATSLKRDSNSVVIRFKTIRDSIFVPVRDTSILRDIPVVVEVEKKGAATPWIIASIAAGIVALLLLIIIILRK